MLRHRASMAQLTAVITSILCVDSATAQVVPPHDSGTLDNHQRTHLPKVTGTSHTVGSDPQGSASHRIPLEVPPARQRPNLGLLYSSAPGPTAAGLPHGWSIDGILTIHRSRREREVFFLQGEKYARLERERMGANPTVDRYRPVTERGGALDVRHDTVADEWIVQSGEGITWVLRPTETTPAAPAITGTWRAVERFDTSGNHIRYEWHGAQLTRVLFGGVRGPVDTDFLCIEMVYTPRTHARYRGSFGSIRQDVDVLERIVIGRWHGGEGLEEHPMDPEGGENPVGEVGSGLPRYGDCEAFREYVLVHERAGGTVLLSEVEEIGYEPTLPGFPAAVSQLHRRRFEYSAPATSEDHARSEEGMIPLPDLGRTASFCRMDQVDEPCIHVGSGTVAKLVDMNSDGLLDYLDTTAPGGEMRVRYQTFDETTGVRGWDAPLSVPNAPDDQLITETHKTSLEPGPSLGSDDDYRSIETATLVDLNSDGFPDRLTVTRYYDDQYVPGADRPSMQSGTTIAVRYGGSCEACECGQRQNLENSGLTELEVDAECRGSLSRGFEACTYDEPSAIHGLRVTRTAKGSGGVWGSSSKSTYSFTISDLFDVDGDGWLDIVAANPLTGEIYVYLHGGKKGEGWSFSHIVVPPWTQYRIDDPGQPAYEPGYQYLSAKIATNSTSHSFMGFRDLNSDGLMDFVIAGESTRAFTKTPVGATDWLVYLGNGVNWEEPIIWSAPMARIECMDQPVYSPGQERHAEATQRLLDVDRDGLVDLVLANGGEWEAPAPQRWHRNLGDGFDLAGASLPAFWNPSTNRHGDATYKLGNAVVESLPEIPSDCVLCSSVECDEPMEGFEDFEGDGCWCVEWDYSDCPNPSEDWPSFGSSVMLESSQFAVVIDIDGDGVLDAANLRSAPTVPSAPAPIHFGQYPPAYMLSEVTEPLKRRTTLGYRSSSRVSPAGGYLSRMRQGLHVVDEMTTTDLVSEITRTTNFTYARGWSVNGIFRGFAERTTITTEDPLGTSRQLRVIEEYERRASLPPLVTRREVATAQGYLPSPWITPGWTTREVLETTFGSFGTHPAHYRLPTDTHRTQTPEHGDFESSEVTLFDWDGDGNLTQTVELDLADYEPMERRETTYDYASSGALTRLARRQVRGAGGALRAEARWFYDGASAWGTVPGAGLLTRAETLAGWPGGGEAPDADMLVSEYHYGSRGETTRVVNPVTGMEVAQRWTFGAAVLNSRTDGVHHEEKIIDDRGRVARVNNVPNHTARVLRYDGLDRVLEEHAVDQNQVAYRLRSYEYGIGGGAVVGVDAHYTVTRRTYDETGAVESTQIDSLDGGDHVTFAVSQDANGNFVTNATMYDLSGRAIRTYHPQPTGPVLDFASMDITREDYFNGLGELRRTDRDVTLGLGSIIIQNPNDPLERSAGTVHTVDEEGFERRTLTDSRGNLRAVTQDGVVTASYEYDSLGRRTHYTDGEAVTRTWSYDLAGRLRRTVGPDIGERDYEYLDIQRARITDSAGHEAQWHYDALGRPVLLLANDPSSGGTLTWSWQYDSSWVGRVAQTQDPTGTTTWGFDALGNSDSQTRTWSDGSPTVVMQASYDIHGRRTSNSLPSGATVQTTYSYGWATRMELGGTNGAAVALDLTYDLHGRPTGWTSNTLPVSVQYLPDLAGRQESATISNGTQDWHESYTWLENDLLQRTDYANGYVAGVTPQPGTMGSTEFAYDGMRRLTGVTETYGQLVASEQFVYGAAGSLLSRVDPDGVSWAYGYDAAAYGARLLNRTASDGRVEAFTFDDAGRAIEMTGAGSVQAFQYDGLGRARDISRPDGTVVVIHRDADGAVIRRDHIAVDGSVSSEYIVGPWRYDARTGTTVEQISGIGTVVNHDRRFDVRSPVGHVFASLDDAGNLVSQRRYHAFGDVWSAVGAPLDHDAFHGLELEGESGLYLAGPRTFTPSDGQWLQPDPLMLEGLVAADIDDPQQLAPYRYARNTPTIFRDPSGLDPECDEEGGDENWDGEGLNGQEAYEGFALEMIGNGVDYATRLGGAGLEVVSKGKAAFEELIKGGKTILDAEDERNERTGSPGDARTDSWQNTPIEPVRDALRGDSNWRVVQAFTQSGNGGNATPPPTPQGQLTNPYTDSVPEGWQDVGPAGALLDDSSEFGGFLRWLNDTLWGD